MKLNFNFSGKTLLKDWWKIVRDNFTAIQTEHNTLSNKLDTEITQRTNADVGLADKITAETKARESTDNTLQGNIDAEAKNRRVGDSELREQILTEQTNRTNADDILNGEKADKTDLYGKETDVVHTITHSLEKSDLSIDINTSYGDGTITINSLAVQTKIFLDGNSAIQTEPISASFSAEKGEEGEKWVNLLYDQYTGKLGLEVTEQPEAGNVAKIAVTYMKAEVAEMYAGQLKFDGIKDLRALKTDNKNSFLAAVNEIFAKAQTALKTKANTADLPNIKKNPNATDGDIIDTHLTVGTRGTGTVGTNSLTSGINNTASGFQSVVLGGKNNTASGNGSVVLDGENNTASGYRSVVLGGIGNTASNYQIKMGRYSLEGTAGSSTGTTGDVLTVGIGTSEARKNGFRVDYTGKCFAYNTVASTGADYAEVWEWIDGNPNNEDRVGKFVAFEGAKIRLATPNDPKEILGVISAMPAILGDNFADEWHEMYLKDKFGRLLTEHKTYEAEYDEKGKIIHEAYEADEFIINSEYDPTQKYIPRLERPEYDAVGTHGKLAVTDDGTCQVGGFCMPANNGIATASENGFYVMERIDETTVKIYVR